MNKPLIFIVFTFALLCAFSFADEITPPNTKASTSSISDDKPIEVESAVDINQTSRIRMFGQNGALALLFKNSTCVKGFWSSDGEKVSGGLGSALSSFIGSVSNTSLGIPETDSTRFLSKSDGILSKAYFREYVIPTNKPTSMMMKFQDISSFYRANGVSYERISPSCGGAISFIPQAGADYEAAFSWPDNGKCTLGVNQVVVKEGKVELIPVPVSIAPKC